MSDLAFKQIHPDRIEVKNSTGKIVAFLKREWGSTKWAAFIMPNKVICKASMQSAKRAIEEYFQTQEV